MTGFEQSDSEDAELAHSMQVRAHIPRFVGKRTVDEDEVDKLLLKQEAEVNDMDNLQNMLDYLLKNSDENLQESSRFAQDLSLLNDQDSNSDPTEFERVAKWAPRFVGKRRSPMFVGRRRAPLFIGKRYAPRFVGKRGAPMFIGRRGHPLFVGRRDSPLFIGRRENARPADTSFYVGGKRSVDAASKQARAENSAGYSNFPTRESNEKREREIVILPQEMRLIHGKPVYSEFSKRFVVPEFVGKRDRFLKKYEKISSEKRFDTPFFVGRRSDDMLLSDLSDLNPEFSILAQQPAIHSDSSLSNIK